MDTYRMFFETIGKYLELVDPLIGTGGNGWG
jgi:hypothetical protein